MSRTEKIGLLVFIAFVLGGIALCYVHYLDVEECRARTSCSAGKRAQWSFGECVCLPAPELAR
jgi:hypothetical protein